MASVTLDGNEYSADGSAPRDMLNGGHRTWFIPALADMLTEAQGAVTARLASEAARDLSQAYAAALSGASSSSITVATGSVSITASAGKQWQVGQHLYVARIAAPTTWLAARVVSYNPGTGALSLDVVAVNGSGTYTDWQISIGGAQGPSGTINSLAESTKSAGYTLASGDKGKVLRLDGTFTLAFTSAATLGAGWWCWLHNVGSGPVTLDPNSTQQIDGLTSYLSYPGEMRLVWCTGSAFRSVVAHPFRLSYTASGTFVDPPGYRMLNVRGWGAGGSGAKGSSSGAVTGGGGGGCMDHQYQPAPGTSRTVTIGAGGAAVTSASTAGNAGGDTIFGALFTWPGGPGGTTSTAVSGASSAPGNLSGAYLGATGDDNKKPVFGGGGSHTTTNNPGKSSIYGGAGGGAGSVAAGARNGGTSMYGGAGGAGGDSTDGADGAAPAGAGGGTRTGATSGAGARGQLEIWGVC
jgi:hypothetical protein